MCVRSINNAFNLANVIRHKTFPVPRLMAAYTPELLYYFVYLYLLFHSK